MNTITITPEAIAIFLGFMAIVVGVGAIWAAWDDVKDFFCTKGVENG